MGCPTHKGSNGRGGSGFWSPSHRLYEPRLGAMIRLTSHEGEVIHDKIFLMRNPRLKPYNYLDK